MDRARLDWQELCVCKLQCVYRGVLARRKLRQVEQQRGFAASTVFQAWFRGYKGRGIAEVRRIYVRNQAALDIQRVFRSHLSRQQTKRAKFRLTCAAMTMQKAFKRFKARKRFAASRKIASLIMKNYRHKQAEKVQAVLAAMWGRSWLILEKKRRVKAEERRREKEIEVVELATVTAVMNMQESWTTHEGRQKFNEQKEQIRQQHIGDKHRRKELSKNERQKADVREVFDSFDVDGSGTMDKQELHALLVELCVPTTPDYLDEVLQQIDDDDSGQISFDEFYGWWQSPEFQSAHKDQVATVKLRGNKFLRTMMGKQLVDETKRVMEFQTKSQVFKESLSRFRESEPPPCTDSSSRAFTFPWEQRQHYSHDREVLPCRTADELRSFYDVFYPRNR